MNQSIYFASTYNGLPSDEQIVLLITFLLIMSAIAIVGYIVSSIFLGLVFKKAHQKAWKAWVPVYNSWVTLELGGQRGFWAILLLIPLVNFVAAVFLYIAFYHIGLRLGKDPAFVLLAIFFPLIWVIWLAVDKSVWQEPTDTPASPTATAPTFTPPQPPTNI